MYFIRPPFFLRLLYPSVIWDLRTEDPILYLTFDDGPVPEVTPWVLDTLKQYDASATFFCVGENVTAHPEIYERILTEGHSVGNHTCNHLNGWKTDTETYFNNIYRCGQSVPRPLFRPPYGRMTLAQYRRLIREGYTVVMWDVLSTDFDKNNSGERCYRNVVQNSRNGSVIVFHDSIKASERLRYCLPRVLDYYSSRGFKFLPLKQGGYGDEGKSNSETVTG
jgi:peptidoglycan-N-acetylglucosamine deacetylase